MERPAAVSLPALLAGRAEAAPDQPAILGLDGETLTYARLHEQALSTGAALRGLGVARSDRVALLAPNGPEAAVAFLSIATACCCAPLNPSHRAAELDWLLADLAPAAVVVDPEAAGEAAAVAAALGIRVVELRRSRAVAGAFELDADAVPAARFEPAGADDFALALHTSGTTARPKLVPLRHRNLCASAAAVASTLELTPRDRCLNVMPLFHIHGLVGALLASVWAGGGVLCAPGLDAPSFFRWLDHFGPTWYTAVPTIHQAVLARAPRDGLPVPTRLRFVRSSSSALPQVVSAGLEQVFGVPVIEAYGMTEASHQMASNPLPPDIRKHGSVGRATGIELAVMNAEGTLLPDGATGEVVIRGSSVFSGYAGNEEANREAFVDGWFRTGDEGVLDADGYLFLRGRIKEIVNRGGEKVAPAEVEEALLAHPAIAEAVVFALPDDRLGEEVGAAVVLAEGAGGDETTFQRFVGERLAEFKVPRVVALVEEIPKGPTGKLQRRGMAERLGLRARPSRATDRSEPGSPLERRLATIWSEVLDVEVRSGDDDFFALGGDSLLAAVLVTRLREEGIASELSLTSLVWAPTIAAMAAEIERSASGSDAPLVPLQTGGGQPPLFFVHALDGEVVRFGALARALGPEQPVFGLKAVGVERQVPVHASIEEMAGAYLAEVRAVRPRGPYLLGAMCMGGPIVIEMARALLDQGEDVPLVALVDPRVPAWESSAPLRRAAGALGLRTLSLGRQARDDEWRRGPSATAFLLAMATIRDSYVMRSFPGDVHVYVSDAHLRLGWMRQVEGNVRVHHLGGEHMDLLRHPTVDRLAALIAAAVAEVAGDGVPGR